MRVVGFDIRNDINKFGQYLDTLSSGKLSPTLVDPIHLCDELLRIQKELPPAKNLPENPAANIWHYYKYLTVSSVLHADKIILLIRLPLVISDFSMTLHKVYHLPIFNQHTGKSLKYNLEGNYLAITNDRNSTSIPSEYEFIECTLASGHFCSLNSNRHDITIEPPLTFVNLQPACSAFSAKIKLPPYFKKYLEGFAIAIKAANLHPNKCGHIDFHILRSFNISSLSTIQQSNLKKSDSTPSVPVIS